MRQEVREENRTICSAFDARLALSVPHLSFGVSLSVRVRAEYRRAVISSKKQMASSSRHLLKQKDELEEESQQSSSGNMQSVPSR